MTPSTDCSVDRTNPQPGAARSAPGLRRRQVMLAATAMACGMPARASVPTELRSIMPTATLSGSIRFTYWGFSVYDASLWVLPGFRSQTYAQHPFALHLQYLRNFTNAAITSRTVDEMARQAEPASVRRQLWQQWLEGAFPDVRAGDRLTGVNRPGEGSVFFTNGRQTGMVPDSEFSRLFFGIWLSKDSPEPAMRQALLSNVYGS